MRGCKVYVPAALFAFLFISQGLAFIVKKSSEIESPETELQKVHSRQRRGLSSALLKVLAAAAITTTAGSLSFNLYLEAEGCCKLSGFCTKQEELSGFHDQWTTKANEIDEIALAGSLEVTSINSIHTNSEIIRTKLVKVIRKLDDIVTTLFDSDMNELLEIQNKIDEIYRENKENMNTWTVDDFNVKFQGVWGDPKGMAILFAPIMVEAGSHALSSFLKWNRLRKIQKTVGAELSATILGNSVAAGSSASKAARTLQASTYSQTKLVKSTTLARYQASMGTASKFRKGVAGAFSLFIIGFEAWNVYETAKKCEEVKKQVNENHKTFKEELEKLDVARTEVDNANVEIDEAYKYLTDSISSEDFLAGIENIEDLVKGASTQNEKTKEEAANLSEFRTKIAGVVASKNNEEIHRLQGLLSSSIGDIEYHYDCLLKKAEAIRSIINNCKAGHNALDVLYEEKKNSFAMCVVNDDGTTPPYLSYADVEATIKSDAAANNYQENCRLNSAILKTLVCTENCNNMATDTKTIEEKNNLTSDEITTLCGEYLCVLSDTEKNQICYGKTVFKATVEQSTMFFSSAKKPAAIAHYESC